MTEPTYDDERALRAALGTLLVDEPPPTWAVADDVARGRALRTRRRARFGAGAALVAVAVLVIGLVGPLRAVDRTAPTPLGSATPSATLTGSQTLVADYLASLGWPATSTKVTLRTQDGAVVSAEYDVRSSSNPDITASVRVLGFDTAEVVARTAQHRLGYRAGSLPLECGAACDPLIASGVGCLPVPTCSTDSYVVVGPGAPTLRAGSQVAVRTYVDGTELDAVASPPQCVTCGTESTAAGSILTLAQLLHVLDLTGKPTLRDQPSMAPSTVIAEQPNPYYVGHNPDAAWVTARLTSLSAAVAPLGVTVSERSDRNRLLIIVKGNVIARLEPAYASTTTDAPECLGLPDCMVLQPWTSARGGAVQIAVTETTIAPGTVSTAMRGPSYQVLVRSGHRLVRLDESTTFGTVLSGQAPGFVITWQQLAALSDSMSFPPAASPRPSAS